MRWQFYPSFGLQYTKEIDHDLNVATNYLIIGCFQSWTTLITVTHTTPIIEITQLIVISFVLSLSSSGTKRPTTGGSANDHSTYHSLLWYNNYPLERLHMTQLLPTGGSANENSTKRLPCPHNGHQLQQDWVLRTLLRHRGCRKSSQSTRRKQKSFRFHPRNRGPRMNTLIQYMNSEFLMGMLIAVLVIGYCVACYFHGKSHRLPIIRHLKDSHWSFWPWFVLPLNGLPVMIKTATLFMTMLRQSLGSVSTAPTPGSQHTPKYKNKHKGT